MHIRALFLRSPSASQHLAPGFDTRKPFAGSELDIRGPPARARLTQPPVSWDVGEHPSLAFGCRSWQSARIRAGGWARERPVLLAGRGPPETAAGGPRQRAAAGGRRGAWLAAAAAERRRRPAVRGRQPGPAGLEGRGAREAGRGAGRGGAGRGVVGRPARRRPGNGAPRSLSATPPVSFSGRASALFRFPVVPSSKRN